MRRGISRTFNLAGITARPVWVEVDVHRGLPHFTVVGLPDAAVREARERMRAALVNCGFEFPLRRIVVSLTPESLRKPGPGMDLAIAAALLTASGQLQWERLASVALAGELALDGSTRPVQGALAMAEAARESGAEAIVLPAENVDEAALAEGIDVFGIETLGQLPALAAGDVVVSRPQAPLGDPGLGQADPTLRLPRFDQLAGFPRPELVRLLEAALEGLRVQPPDSFEPDCMEMRGEVERLLREAEESDH
jgi:magnesium chelatase family protein